jgi:hypothetical protein
MSKLINQASEHIDALSPHVQSGHYDLIDPDGQIILPTLWDATVQPGCAVQQHLWPLPEGETEPKPPPPNPKRKKQPAQPPPPPPPPPGYGILNVDEVLRSIPKKKKPPASGIVSLMPSATKPKPMSKEKPSPSPPLESSSQQLPPDVVRIADYKHKQTKETGSLIDEIRESMAPSDDDKKDVARYYLMKWTTEWESAHDKGETRGQGGGTVKVLG